MTDLYTWNTKPTAHPRESGSVFHTGPIMSAIKFANIEEGCEAYVFKGEKLVLTVRYREYKILDAYKIAI